MCCGRLTHLILNFTEARVGRTEQSHNVCVAITSSMVHGCLAELRLGGTGNGSGARPRQGLAGTKFHGGFMRRQLQHSARCTAIPGLSEGSWSGSGGLSPGNCSLSQGGVHFRTKMFCVKYTSTGKRGFPSSVSTSAGCILRSGTMPPLRSCRLSRGCAYMVPRQKYNQPRQTQILS